MIKFLKNMRPWPLAFLLMLPACADVKDELGFGRQPPDEFSVVDRPPLAMPPDFVLAPPQPGAPRPQEKTARDTARETVGMAANSQTAEPSAATEAKTTAPPAAALSSAASSETASGVEADLLGKAGANAAKPDIRQTVDQEAGTVTDRTPEFVRSLLFWRKDEGGATATTVDPAAEAARIKAAKAAGQPVNTGETPVAPAEGGSATLGTAAPTSAVPAGPAKP